MPYCRSSTERVSDEHGKLAHASREAMRVGPIVRRLRLGRRFACGLRRGCCGYGRRGGRLDCGQKLRRRRTRCRRRGNGSGAWGRGPTRC